jgi:hypothetical protein
MKMSFKKNKDDVFTINLPESDLIFTRYLYLKDEVRLSLLVSILNKSDDSIFWGYELYYSGFKNEFFELIWKIYYDFFATLNPTFEAYLKKKHRQWLLNESSSQADDKIVKSIIQDLLFRPFNTDVFLLRNICENFEFDIEYHDTTEKITDTEKLQINMKNWIKNNDYRSLAQWILNENYNEVKNNIELEDIYRIVLNELEIPITNKNIYNDFYTDDKKQKNNTVLLAKIMTLISKKNKLKKGKSIYIKVEKAEIIPFETITCEMINSNNILETACLCGIDDLNHLSLFKLKRQKYDLNDKYWYNWLYHASFSPIWSKRIQMYKGYPDYSKRKIIFMDDNLEDEFYKMYGLEPDEQKSSVQEKSIIKIEKKYDWKWFDKKYKKNGLVEIYQEELDEFDNDGINY